MKTIKTLSAAGLSLNQLLGEANHSDIVLMNGDGSRFAIVRLEEGGSEIDPEIRSLQSSPPFMSDLTGFREEARAGRLRSLEAVEASYAALEKVPALLENLTEEEADRLLKQIGVDPRDHGMVKGKELIDLWKGCVEDLAGRD